MNENKWGLYGLIFGIVEFNLGLLIYIFLNSITVIVWVVSLSFAFILVLILVNALNQIKANSCYIDELIEKLKRTEELNDIRLNIKELQRKVFKNV